MKIGSLQIAHREGDSQHEETADARVESRQYAIKQYQEVAQKEIMGKLHEVTNALVGLSIQFRAHGGSAAGSDLGAKLREAADFLEDL